jgi:phospholipase A-2-activating protein
VRDFTEVPGLGFASCSNDEMINIRSIDGHLIMELKGHQGFVFSVSILESEEVISASDDRTVRVRQDGK